MLGKWGERFGSYFTDIYRIRRPPQPQINNFEKIKLINLFDLLPISVDI